MPYSEVAAVGGSVTVAGEVASATGQVSNPSFVGSGFVGAGFVAAGAALSTVTGTIARGRAAALEGPSTAIGVRIKLDGAWVPEEDLVGPVEISDAVETHRRSARFSLAGHGWSVFRTLSTWTRVPVEIWFREGSQDEHLELRGWLVPGTGQTAPGLEPVVSLEADDSSIYDDVTLCREVEPWSGLTRGEIATELALDAGIDGTLIPAGAVYDKPLFTDGQSLFSLLRDFGEPEGWSWRLDPQEDGAGHVLVAYNARPKQRPQPPDEVWTLDDCDSVEVTAPERPASRYVVRGLGAVVLDEAGEVTETERVLIEAAQPPLVATHKQDADGSVTETGLDPITSTALFPQSELIITRTRRDGLDFRETVEEYAWYNPAAARLTTDPQGATEAAPGYYFAKAYILETGAMVAWPRERWVQVGHRTLETVYDDDEQPVETRLRENRWHRRTAGVQEVAGNPIIGVGIGDDDRSWRIDDTTTGDEPIEGFGPAREVITKFTYGDNGSVLREDSTEYGWYSPAGDIEKQNHFILYGGTGQVGIVADWIEVVGRSIVNLVSADGTLLGVTETTTEWTAPRQPAGDNDWGDGRSYLSSEVFRATSRKHTQYRRRADGTVEEITFGDGPPVARVITGRIPLPRFKLSPWTRLRQQPLEAVLDDETLEELFGYRSDVLVMDYLLDADEAQKVAQRRHQDATSRDVTVQRFESLAKPGDTVLMIDPRHALHHRGLVVSRHRRRDLSRPDSAATYHLMVPT